MIKNIISTNIFRINTSKYDQFPIEKYQFGQRLDRYLKQTPIGWLSSQKHLRKKQLLIKTKNGDLINDNDYRLENGDILLIAPFLKKKYYQFKQSATNSVEYDSAKQALEKMLIYDNKHITILNKEIGYSVQGGKDFEKNLFTLMAAKYKKQNVHITHRLDKVTSGIVMFAKNRQTAQLIQMGMEDREKFNKYYLALAEGGPIASPDYIRCNIEWTTKHKARLCSQTAQKSKDCITYYELLKQDQKMKFMGLKLLTGRKHQLRCHLSSYLNNPILNDSRYGGKIVQPENEGIFLHAFGMKINNPEIVQKVFLSEGKEENKKNGQVKIEGGTIRIIGGLPTSWKNIVTDDELWEIGEKIEKGEQSMRRKKPKKNNVTEIV